MTIATAEPTTTAEATAGTSPAWSLDAATFRTLSDAVAPAAKHGRAFLGAALVELTADRELGTLTARADDFTQGIIAWTTADVERSGTVAAAHDVLAALLARVAGPLSCAAAPKGLSVETDGTVATVRTMGDPASLPLAPIPAGDGLIVPAAALRHALAVAAQAADPDSYFRPVLAGVHLAVRDGTLFATTADGFRCALAAVGPAAGPWPDHGLTPPAKTVGALIRLLGKLSADATVRLAPTASGGRLVVTAGAWQWSSALIDGAYPDVAKMIHSHLPGDATTAHVAAADLAAAVATAMPFSPTLPCDKEKSRRIRIELAEGIITVSAGGADLGEVRRTLPAETAGPAVFVTLDANFLRDALAVCPETVELCVALPNQAVVLADPDGPDRFVIMPMVIEESSFGSRHGTDASGVH